MKSLPPPTTFSEGQRLVYGLLASLAGIFCGTMAIVMICLLMWGKWPPSEYHTIVVIFGWSLGGFIAAMVAVIVGLLTGGPVGRFKAGISKEGATFETDSTASPTVTTTTTVTPTPVPPTPPVTPTPPVPTPPPPTPGAPAI